jgi:hypothetical protein
MSGVKKLKAEFQTKLDLPGWIIGGSDHPEVWSSQCRTGIGQIDLVEGIKKLRPKLDRHVFPRERKVLVGAKDPVSKSGSSLRVPSQVTKSVLRGNFESSGV